MKKDLLHSLTRRGGVILAVFMLLFTSCAIGYDDSETFSSGVTNTQLESPDLSKLSVTSRMIDGVEKMFIEWPVVYGAGGYKFSLYIVNDPDNPIAVGEENEIIDGCSTLREKLEDTKYEVVVQALGNEKDKNIGAETPSKKEFNTFVPTVALIPDGTDLAEYFAANPVQASETEQGYELVAGGSYTLNGVVDFGGHWITLHGTKGDNPKITYGKDGRISTMGGLKLKFIDFDCNEASNSGALLMLNPEPADSLLNSSSFYAIKKDIAIESCNIKGINEHLFYDNGKKYVIDNFRISDCVVELNTTKVAISVAGGLINNITLQRSTFYTSPEKGTNFFIQYANSQNPVKAGFTSGSINFYNNTFYNISNSKNIANYSGMAQKHNTLNLSNNIFVDSGKGEVIKRLASGNASMNRAISYNTFWYNGASKEDTETGNQSPVKADPQFLDPANADFTVGGAEHIANRIGDPRWLPAVE